MAYTVRRARDEDYPGLTAVLTEADQLHIESLSHIFRPSEGPVRSREHVEGLLENPEALVLVAEEAGEIAGCLIAFLRKTPPVPFVVPRRTVMVETLGVAAAYRRQGVGRALMAAVQDWAAAKGADALELNVYEFNRGAIAFYEELGYRTERRSMTKKVSGAK